MPDVRWNVQTWTSDLKQWLEENSGKPYGDQWGDPEEHPELRVVRDDWLLPLVAPERTVLEIGSGGGRWTQYLLGARRLYCVDVNPEMFHYLLQRFGARANISFVQTSGTDLEGIPAGSVDLVFSFGTFVHLDPPIIARYLAALKPLLRPGGDLLLQYADKDKPLAAENEGFAPTTGPIMEGLLVEAGYEVVRHGTAVLPHSNVVHARPA